MNKYFVLLCVSFLGLAACEIKPEIKADPNPEVKPFEHLVQGPELSGNWTSACDYDLRSSGGYKTLNLVIKGQDIIRTTTKFSDDKCQQNPVASTINGKFRFNKTYTQGFFEVEYKLDLGKGVTQTTFENVRLKNGMLFISEFYIGSVEPTLALLPAMTPITAHEAVIGQKATYVSLLKGVTQEELYTITQYNAAYGDWNVDQEVKQGSNVDVTALKVTDIWGTTKYNNLMKYCESQGHTREIITVPAGTFDTCKMKKSKGNYWYGNVPVMGIVKIEYFDGEYRAELKSFNP